MNTLWKPLPTPHIAEMNPFPRMAALIFALVVGMLALIINAGTLDAETLTLKILIWRLLAFPASCMGLAVLMTTLVFYSFRAWSLYIQRAYVEDHQEWKERTSVCLRLADHASLFPVDDAALKMLKLEGEMPSATDLPMKLTDEADEASGMNRTQTVVKRLLNTLDSRIIVDHAAPVKIWYYIRNASDALNEEVGAVISAHCGVFQKAEMIPLTKPPASELLDEWIWEPFSGFRLIITVELHNEVEHSFCEHACALLFSRKQKIPDERVPVWCFTGMNSRQHLLKRNLDLMMTAEQVKHANLRHIWSGNLRGEGLHLLHDAFSDTPTDVDGRNWHSMLMGGKWSPAYRYLMLEWAASAVRNGQRGQFLAFMQDDRQQIHMMLLSGEAPPDINVYTNYHQQETDANLGWLGSLFGMFPLVIFTYFCVFIGWDTFAGFWLMMMSLAGICIACMVILGVCLYLYKSEAREIWLKYR